MKRETVSWIAKAEGNWRTAQWAMQADDPVWDDICFLCQQCGEKYLKSFLREQGISPPREHDLIVLHNLSAGLLPQLDVQDMAYLTTLSVAIRYPGVDAKQEDAEEAIKAAEGIRSVVRTTLGLPQ